MKCIPLYFDVKLFLTYIFTFVDFSRETEKEMMANDIEDYRPQIKSSPGQGYILFDSNDITKSPYLFSRCIKP